MGENVPAGEVRQYEIDSLEASLLMAESELRSAGRRISNLNSRLLCLLREDSEARIREAQINE